MDNKNIAQEIVILRAEKGWTQQQFAEKLKTSQRTVAAWEVGDSIPRKTMKVKIAQAFGLPANQFLDSNESDIASSKRKDENFSESKVQDLMDHIEDFISSSRHGLDGEKKKLVLESIREILDTSEKRK